MKMKTFQADTMQEALSMVKDEMGPDAIILKSRRASRKVGMKTQPCFEVTAALEETTPVARPAPMSVVAKAPVGRAQTPATPGMYDWKGSLRRVDDEGTAVKKSIEQTTVSAVPASTNSGSLIELLRSEIREMKDHVKTPSQELRALKDEIKAMMDAASIRNRTPAPVQVAATFNVPPASPVPAKASDLQACLTEMDIEPELASELVQAINVFNPDRRTGAPFSTPETTVKDTEILAKCMADRIRVTGGIRLIPRRPTTVALVGPTGVGKTTTLAKLAALAKLEQGKKVGIISADNFRMGANEQLQLFGRTAGIPVRAVFSAADVTQAQKDFADCDLILVDTAGRSHTHLEMWRELQSLLSSLRPDEIHLVLSGPTRMRELWHQYGLYRELGATSLIFTKVDECLTLGCLYNLARRAEAPLSYLCNGQIIPDHILLAKPETVAAAIANEAKFGMTAKIGSASKSAATAKAGLMAGITR